MSIVTKHYYLLFFRLDQIKSLQFTSWWVENGDKNNIVIVFRLDGQPHEIIIKDTKYYVKELYSADKRNTAQLAVSYCFLTLFMVFMLIFSWNF